MPENNPALDDLEVSSIDTDNKKSSAMEDIASALETILSEEHFDQKTVISPDNELGLIGIDVIQAHMLRSFKYEFPSLIALKNSKQEHAVSVNGIRSQQIVEIFKSIQTNIISADTSNIGNRLLGRR